MRSRRNTAASFISGWRPILGWVCALALAYQYIAKPLLTWALAAPAGPRRCPLRTTVQRTRHRQPAHPRKTQRRGRQMTIFYVYQAYKTHYYFRR